MIWADRLGALWFFFVLGLMGFTGLTFVSWTWTVLWLIGPWAALRAVDFVFFGHTRLPDALRAKQQIFPPGH